MALTLNGLCFMYYITAVSNGSQPKYIHMKRTNPGYAYFIRTNKETFIDLSLYIKPSLIN